MQRDRTTVQRHYINIVTLNEIHAVEKRNSLNVHPLRPTLKQD